ncbi:MDR family MFS transporter [Alicyclobacillus dauci]|uniref:MFS transporter n=1 Tax=Alicyclobacillus dauci TaxID=1475485 RepID=A0ABY6Z5L4_9BACL|nr:MFS transporter [Alicyclobacillus dauci]WAH38102.1 MFS transporter [Alicyclobacillus dauci]
MVRAFQRTVYHMTEIPNVIWLLGLGCLINVGGLSLLWPVNSIYIHVGLHKSMAVAGLVLMVFSGAGLFGSFVGGWLYDRIGAMRILVYSLVISCVSILLPAMTSDFAVYVVVMAVFGVTCAIPFPVLNAVAGHAWPDGGRRSFNFLYVSNNIGVAIGTALGGVLAARSFQVVFYGIALAYLGLLFLITTALKKPFSDIRRSNDESRVKRQLEHTATVLPWGGIAILFTGYTLAWAIYVQWQSTVSVYMQSTGYTLSAYSLLWTLNGLLIFLSQPLVSFVTRRFPALSFHMIGGTVLYALSFTVMLFAHHYFVYVIAMVLTTLGEIFIWPAVPAAVAQIAPPSRLGMLQGLVGSCATAGRMIGPVVGGVLYDQGALHLVLLIAILSTVFPLVLFSVYHRFTTPNAGEVRPEPRA